MEDVKQDDHVLEIQDGFIDVNDLFIRMKELGIIKQEVTENE